MTTSFTRCSECVVFHNWHLKGDWKKSFICDFVNVPTKLAKTMGQHICNEVKIEVPNGKSYRVEVCKEDNGLVFKSGWAAFVNAYDLEQRDILLFESSGSCCFEVRIFNQSCCEKELSCVAFSSTPCVHESNMSYDNHDMQSLQKERHGDIRSKRMMCKECAALDYWHHKDKIRFFLVKMGVDELKNGLIIPKKFANNVREGIPEEIKLELPDGRTHSIQLAKEQHELALRSGWDKFARSCELVEGDILLFGYSGNSHFKVRIFNVSGCDKLLSCLVKNTTPCVQERYGRSALNGHRMNETCTICIESVKRHYWHMDGHDWCFFKVMCIENFKDEMAIPKKFSTNFRGHVSDEVKLEVPDGQIYSVQVAREHDELVFRSGWAKFANAYELELGYILVFTYSGKSHFKVRILKQRGCEKELSCVMMERGPDVQERHIVHDQSLPNKRKRQDDGSDHSNKTSKMTPAGSPSQKTNSELNNENVLSSKDIQDPGSSGGLQGSTRSPYILEMGCKLTGTQKARVDELVKENRSGVSFYVAAMNEKNASDGFLVISKEYAVKHLPHQDQTIKLCRPANSKTSDASLKVITDGTCVLSCILSTGWTGFFRENKLQEGDICAFEVSKSDGRVTITVHHLTKMYVTTSHTKLTSEQDRKIEEKLQVIQPQVEIYVSLIRRNRTSIYVKKSYADAHLSSKGKTIILQRPEKTCTWKVNLYIGNKKNRKNYLLQGGWSKFVRKNKLHDGDICLFEPLENEKEPTMNVYIISMAAAPVL